MRQGFEKRAATWVVNGTAWRLSRLACRVDDGEVRRIPARGPLLLVTNHVNFLEIPLVFSHLQPRPVTGLAKAETWNSPLMGLLFNLWGAIPIRRGEGDVVAIRRVLEALEAGMIVAVSPEGNSKRGRMPAAGQAGDWTPGGALVGPDPAGGVLRTRADLVQRQPPAADRLSHSCRSALAGEGGRPVDGREAPGGRG